MTPRWIIAIRLSILLIRLSILFIRLSILLIRLSILLIWLLILFIRSGKASKGIAHAGAGSETSALILNYQIIIINNNIKYKTMIINHDYN